MNCKHFDTENILKIKVSIKQNLIKIKEQIDNINVKIIAVTKYANQEQIFEAYNLGIRDFGESYLQDAIEKISGKSKYENPKDLINWHFIGRLQKNKVKQVVGKFYLIHSVDSEELAELINKVANGNGLVQDVLLQVNISEEKTKTGFTQKDLRDSFGKLIKLPDIRIKGLMTIAPKTDNKNLVKECFLNLSNLKEEINKNFMTNIKELSMGMSNDYKTAVECGATMLRIGKGLFQN